MRSAGILMHITSLPGPWGVGTMGKSAREFADFLERAGQSFWQLLPLTPTGYGDSPYQSASAFAGNPYLIDPELLVEEGLLLSEEAETGWGEDAGRVDYGLLYRKKLPLLRLAWNRFDGSADFDRFCGENGSWLADFSLYMALKEKNSGAPWYAWEPELKFREPDAIWKARQSLREEIRFYSFVQYLFFRQWKELKDYAAAKGISVIGDIPIYVPYDSVDVWTNPELFQLDETLAPTAVAGCPPDGFSEDGQLWGNPLYRWDRMNKDGYRWWLSRLRAAGKLYDVIRIDHFRGLESYWSVPYGEKTARNGCWVKGPGMDFIQAVRKELPDTRLIAEDLGYLTPEVLKLRDESGLPGMKVLQFAFDSPEPSDYLPHLYHKNTVCYTGTHDNMTTAQWLETANAETKAYAWDYMNLSREEGPVRGVIRTAMSSVSDLCVVPMQDWLRLGGEARMNFPGTFTGRNWSWRMEAPDPGLADEIRRMTVLYGRLVTKKAFSYNKNGV